VFVDRVSLMVRAGDGGAGSAHLASEPYQPRAGADGGDGGAGGDVVLRVDAEVFDLSPFRDRVRHRAESGGAGGRNRRTGASGGDLVLAVPDGTVVSDERGVIADLVGAGASVVAVRGGRGGRGSASLSSARNRVPRAAEPGEEGEERRIELELRLVADAGLVGLPNAGKSTLLAAITAARPKIADYPFTTLSPNLGVAGDEHRMVVADVPGLIHGAHEGRGLGLEFLRHVSRCRALVFVVDLSEEDPAADLATVRDEVGAYDPELIERASLVVGAKADLVPDTPAPPQIDLVVSAVSGRGLDELRDRLEAVVAAAIAAEPERRPMVVVRPGRDQFTIRREGVGFRVSGRGVERWVAETDMEDPRGVTELQRRLVKAGVERRLMAEGARRGDEVSIGGTTFEFIPEEDVDPDEGGTADGDKA
jgi:GTP-binding protein